MVIALAFFKRIFTRSLPMNQAHGLIIAEVYGTCRVSTKTTFALPRARRRVMHRRAAVSRATVGYLAPIFASLGLGYSAHNATTAGGPMSGYAVAHLDEIDEISDGRCPSRPVRLHFGITSFG